MSELNRDAERLFGKAREALSPSAADRKRVRSGLARKLGVAAGVAAVATALETAATAGPAAGAAANAAATGAAATGVSAVLIAKIVVPIVAIGLAVTAVLPAVHGRAATEHIVQSTPSPAVPAAAAERVVNVPAPILRVEARKAPEAATPVAQVQRVSVARRSDVSVPDRAREEIELVAGIQSALAANDGDRALALVAEHARRFPQGALAEEREGARVLALCMRETPERAKALGKAFLDAHPRSPLGGRVQATCGSGGSD